ncbi:MAG: hypothetical protein ACETVZ_03110 [Phycisphaerae bacterium]
MKLIVKTILFVLFSTCVLSSNFWIATAVASNDQEQAQFLLSKMLENRGKVKNFKCVEEWVQYRSGKLRRHFYDRIIERGRPQEKAEELLRKKYILTRKKSAFDNEGRARVEILSGASDPNGNLIKSDFKHIFTWDGEHSIDFDEKPGGGVPTAQLGKKQPFQTTKSIQRAWRTFGGNFCDELAEALKADDEEVSVKRGQDGNYQIEIVFDGGIKKKVSFIDPNRGYSIIEEKRYLEGESNGGYKAKYREVSPGIWFPVEGEYMSGNPARAYSKGTMKVTDITVNDPNFYDGLFHIDFPKGTYVFDSVTGIMHRVGDPMSHRIYDDPSSRTPGQIAKDELEKLVVEAPKKDKFEQTELFIPKAALALEKGTPFVLNLSSGKLINPLSKPDSEKAHKYLTKLGKGDIAWDGTVVATRTATVLTTKQQSHQPLKFTKRKWSGSYKLSEKVELPYSMLVVTSEGENYLMTIHKIKPNGIRVTYKKLNPQEISHYRQKPKDG